MSLVLHSTTTVVEMDAASKALAEAPLDDDRTWAARADSSGIALTTLYNRYREQSSKKEIAQRQQYLAIEKEKALVAFLLLMSSFGQLVRINYVPTLAFSIAQRRLGWPAHWWNTLTQLLVIRKAKVISYKDLDIACAALTAKDKAAAKKGKGKRGRRRKVPARDVEGDVEDGAHALEVGSSVCASKDKRTD